jgi:hypothetical protein
VEQASIGDILLRVLQTINIGIRQPQGFVWRADALTT